MIITLKTLVQKKGESQEESYENSESKKSNITCQKVWQFSKKNKNFSQKR